MGVEEATAAEAMSYDVFKQTRRDEATMMRNEGRGTGGGPWLEERWVADENDGGLRQCEVLQNIKRTDPRAPPLLPASCHPQRRLWRMLLHHSPNKLPLDRKGLSDPGGSQSQQTT